MADRWSKSTIGDLCDQGQALIQTGPFGSQLHAHDYEPVGVPVVPTEAIGRRRLRTEGLPKVSTATAERLSRHKLKEGDILFARRGVQATGLSAIVEKEHEGWLCGTGAILLRLNSLDVDAEFLSFALSSEVSTAWLKSHAVGAVMPNLNESVIRRFPLLLPPITEQQSIARMLGTLDDKIELDRRMNETLEAMARALFKSWFVDFDPVRAKAEKRQPAGMDAEIAALFPASFEESPLGQIPKGWNAIELGTIVEVIDCLHSKKPERQPEGKPLLQLWNIRDDGLLDMSDTYWITEQEYEQWTSRIEAREGDCIITNVGRVGACAQIPADFTAALGRNMTGVRCREHYRFPTFLIECLLSSAMKEEIGLKTDSGTILDALNVRNIPKLRFVLPASRLLEMFEAQCRPLRAKMEHGVKETRTLAALRDALLPKLLSGEIRVREAEREVGQFA